jgi:hypothetical protein
LFDLLPEALEPGVEAKIPPLTALPSTLAGLLVIFVIMQALGH